MKKSKILMPILAIAGLGSTVVPLMAATSCNKKAQLTEIQARYIPETQLYAGSEISKDDIEVTGIFNDGSKQIVKEWTSDQFTDGKHIVTLAEEAARKVSLNIKYLQKETTLDLNVTVLTRCTFGVESYSLYKRDGYITLKQVHIFVYSGVGIQELSAGAFDYDFYEGDTKTNNVSVVKLGNTDTYVAKINTLPSSLSADFKLKAYFKEDTEHKNCLAEVKILIADDGLSFNVTGNTATVFLSSKLGSTFTVPEYVQNVGATEYAVVDYLDGSDDELSGINTLIIPKTITGIKANLFNHDLAEANKSLEEIIYLGTSEQWNYINAGQNWQGNLAIGAYCLGDYQYVKFANRLNSKFQDKCEEISGLSAIVAESYFGGAAGDKYIVRFDYASVPVAADIPQYKYVEVINDPLLPLSAVAINNIYLNGKVLARGTDFTFERNLTAYGFKVKLSDDIVATLNENSVLTINVNIPMGSTNSAWAGIHKS